MSALRFTSTAQGLRRLADAADTDAERIHWQLEAERFEQLAELAGTDPAAARKAYRPTVAYEAPADTPTCPDTCPVCGVDLAGDGYPLQHKTDEGNLCTFRWAA